MASVGETTISELRHEFLTAMKDGRAVTDEFRERVDRAAQALLRCIAREYHTYEGCRHRAVSVLTVGFVDGDRADEQIFVDPDEYSHLMTKMKGQPTEGLTWPLDLGAGEGGVCRSTHFPSP